MTLTDAQLASLDVGGVADRGQDFGRFGRFGRNANRWPGAPAPEAFHGLPGDIVRLLEPHSEADPTALLVQLLVGFGNAIGRGPGFKADGSFHATNLYVLIVGGTASGRKGTSLDRVREVFRFVDPDWETERIAAGLTTGEGLVHQVRDPVTSRRRARKNEADQADGDGYLTEIADEGVSDKRLLVAEGEFAQALRTMSRPGNTLSPMLRVLWERGSAGGLTKTSPTRTTNALVSVIGHITRDELRRELTATDAANGFANRFLFVCSHRSKELPEGGTLSEDALRAPAELVAAMVKHARQQQELKRDDQARELWAKAYGRLTAGQPGLFGAATARAAPQVMRLAVLYALFEGRYAVHIEHLRAALALWDYCERSAAYIFGADLGDPIADQILSALRTAEALSRTEIRDLFKRHADAGRIGVALEMLEANGLAERGARATGGRPVELWTAIDPKSSS